MPLLRPKGERSDSPPKRVKKMSKKKQQEIKEKLSGKNFSPIVAKSSKTLQNKKTKVSTKKVKKDIESKDDTKKAKGEIGETSVGVELKESGKKPTTVNPLKRKVQISNDNLNETKKKLKVTPQGGDAILVKKTIAAATGLVQKKKSKGVLTKVKTVNLDLPKELSKPSRNVKKILVSEPIIPIVPLVATKKWGNRVSKQSCKVPIKTEEPKVLRSTKKQNEVVLPPIKTAARKLGNAKSLTVKGLQTAKAGTKLGAKPSNKKMIKKPSEDKPESKLPRSSSKKTQGDDKLAIASSKNPQVKKEAKSESEPESSSNKVIKKKAKKPTLKLISNIKSLKKGTPSKAKKFRLRNPGQGVVVFKNIPHGFYKKQITKYCSQFGKVTGVYHPVSKNGNSKGYAFVQFAHNDVAKVVAETMNNYVMFYKRMRCEVVPKQREKPWVFKFEKTNEDHARERREVALKQRNRNLSKVQVTNWTKRKQARITALHKKLSALGVDYEFKVGETKETKKVKEEPAKQKVQ